MLKKLILAGALALASVSSASAWDAKDIQKVATENFYEVNNECSGLLLDPANRLVFTAAHCVKENVEQGLKSPFKRPTDVILTQNFMNEDGSEGSVGVTADVVTSIPSLDIAILSIPRKIGDVSVFISARTKVTLAPKDYEFISGSDAYHIGNPYKRYGTITKGIISKESWSIQDNAMNRWLIRYSGGMGSGSSGGPLFDNNGIFEGIATQGLMLKSDVPVSFLGYFIPSSDIWTVLEIKCLADLFGGVNPRTCTK